MGSSGTKEKGIMFMGSSGMVEKLLHMLALGWRRKALYE